MSYTTVANVKLHLGITGTEQDALLQALIDEAKAVIDDYCHTIFEVTVDTTRYFDPTCDVDGRTLYLDAHLANITSVLNGDGAAIAAAEYVTQPANTMPAFALLLKSNSSLVWTYSDAHENAIAITGRWGYSVGVPVAVQRAANRLVELAYNSQGKGGYSKMEVEDLAVTMNGGGSAQAQADILADLQPYRRLV